MTFKAALVQMRSGLDMGRNLADATKLIREAAATGAKLVVTPEITNIFEPDRDRLRAIAPFENDDPAVAAYATLAHELGIHLHIGSMALKAHEGKDGGGKLVNRALLFGPNGKKIAHYDKVHLFDVNLPNGDVYRESDAYEPGNQTLAVKLPYCTLGVAICYDMRFPPLYQALARAGANVIVIPAAFTVPTGEAHWHVLLRARAIETGSYVLAAAQGGTHECGKSTYGHSLIVSPWGEILAEAGTNPCVITAEIDTEKSADTRQRIPALKNARSFDLKLVDATAI
jgi:deaminated glutathione amidase